MTEGESPPGDAAELALEERLTGRRLRAPDRVAEMEGGSGAARGAGAGGEGSLSRVGKENPSRSEVARAKSRVKGSVGLEPSGVPAVSIGRRRGEQSRGASPAPSGGGRRSIDSVDDPVVVTGADFLVTSQAMEARVTKSEVDSAAGIAACRIAARASVRLEDVEVVPARGAPGSTGGRVGPLRGQEVVVASQDPRVTGGAEHSEELRGRPRGIVRVRRVAVEGGEPDRPEAGQGHLHSQGTASEDRRGRKRQGRGGEQGSDEEPTSAHAAGRGEMGSPAVRLKSATAGIPRVDVRPRLLETEEGETKPRGRGQDFGQPPGEGADV